MTCVVISFRVTQNRQIMLNAFKSFFCSGWDQHKILTGFTWLVFSLTMGLVRRGSVVSIKQDCSPNTHRPILTLHNVHDAPNYSDSVGGILGSGISLIHCSTSSPSCAANFKNWLRIPTALSTISATLKLCRGPPRRQYLRKTCRYTSCPENLLALEP